MNNREPSALPAGSSDALEQAAADWLALRTSRALTPAEESAYAAWLATDPRCGPVMAELEAAWRTLDQLAFYPRETGAAPDPDFFARPPEFRRPRRWVRPALTAVAAAAAVAVLVWFHPWSTPAPQSPAGAVAETGSRILHLADGSEVELNVGAEVTEHFTPEERRVRLVHGEAHFTVAKNPARPFVVEARGVAVRAVGTAFNVRMAPSAVEVLVTEGKVSVGSNAPPASGQAAPDAAFLEVGQRTVVDTSGPRPVPAAVESLAASEIDRLLAWQPTRLVFDSTPLAEAVIRINRHTAGVAGAPHLRIGDVELGAMRISGRIRADNIASFVELMETGGFGVAAERAPDGDIVLRRAP